MSEDATTPESTTQHPSNNNTLVDMIAGDCSAPHWVRAAQGHVLGLEKLERFERSTVLAKSALPEVGDIGLQEGLESILAEGILQEGEGVREVVGEAVGSDVSEPVLTTLARGGEELNCNGVEDVTR